MKKVTALFAALTLLLDLCACSAKVQDPTCHEQFDLGVQYLSEGNYEEAVMAFTAAIEINSKQAEVYEKLADAYLALADTEAMLQALRDGYVATESAHLKTRIDELFMLESMSTSEPEPSPNPAQTQESIRGNTSSNISWHYDEGTKTLTISGAGRMEDYDYGNYYRPWSFYNDSIESIEILNGVTSIGDCAFRECFGESNVSIPSSVTSIGDGAFTYCDSLISVTIPNSVTVIGDGAFYGCSSLTDIYYSGSLDQWDAIKHPYGIGDALLSATIHFDS